MFTHIVAFGHVTARYRAVTWISSINVTKPARDWYTFNNPTFIIPPLPASSSAEEFIYGSAEEFMQ